MSVEDDPVLAEVGVSAPRRVAATGILGSLGLIVIYLGLSASPGFISSLFLVGFGFGIVWFTMLLWSATAGSVIWRRSGLYTSSGMVLAEREAMLRVDRGAFAFKPSNGFVVILDRPVMRGWAPGVWWRSARRVGIGGVTAAGACKFMAEQIALELARDEARQSQT